LQKRVAESNIRVLADGTMHDWTVLYISESENCSQVALNECWRGIDRHKLRQFLKEMHFEEERGTKVSPSDNRGNPRIGS
jgi:hypothetical protein